MESLCVRPNDEIKAWMSLQTAVNTIRYCSILLGHSGMPENLKKLVAKEPKKVNESLQKEVTKLKQLVNNLKRPKMRLGPVRNVAPHQRN